MTKNIFVTKYYLKYFDNKEFTYYFPKPIFDNNGIIDDEVLTLSLNKIKKILKVKEVNLILLDPNSYAINIKSNETIEDVSLYIDNSKFKSFDYLDKCGVVFNMDIASLEAISAVSNDLKLKINLFSFIDYCVLNINSENKNEVFFILDKNFYCFIIFKDGNLIKYFYDDRNFYNKRAIENLKNKDYDLSELEIFENLDFEIVASATSSIFSIIDNISDFILNINIYEKNESVDDYLNTTGFKSINDINFNNSIKTKDNLLNSVDQKSDFSMLKYTLPIILIIVIVAELFYYKKINTDVSKLQDLVIEEKNNKILKITENSLNKINENNNNEIIIKEYSDIINSNILLDSKKIFDILNNLSKSSGIIKAYTEDGCLIVELNSNEVDDEYKENIIKETIKNGNKIYELKFEVVKNEFK